MEDKNPNISADTEPLAIIGISCLFPKAEDTNAYWANIREGIDAITEIPATHWRTIDYFDDDPKSPDMTYGKRGGFLSSVQFNPMEYNIPPNILESIDTSQLLGLVAAGNALRDAGYGPEHDYDRTRTSVIMGVTGALELVIPLGARLGHPAWRKALKDAGLPDDVASDVMRRISDSYVSWQENSFPGLLGNVVAGRISKHFDMGGTNCVVDAACASSLSALHLAGMELATGKADMVVTGGIDTFNSIFMYMCFSKTPALSPTGDARPFDASGDGTILGEGLGVLVIKRLADAERDKDRIYAVIKGIGSSSDGRGEAIYAPSAAGQKKALIEAYGQAGVSPESIALVEAHGTGTRVGDAVEVSALRDVYGEADIPWCALGSVKSQIGHTKAAAGAAGLIKASLALYHKVIPPTIKVNKPLEEIDSGRTPFYLTSKKRPWLPFGTGPRRAAVSAFGFGGSNFHVVLEEYRSCKAAVDWDGNVQIFAFSGNHRDKIDSALSSIPVGATWNEIRGASAASRLNFDNNAPLRITLVVERNKSNLSSQVENARKMLKERPDNSWSTPDGTFFAARSREGKIGVIFPGQGSQYTGMLRDMACAFPAMVETLATADDGFTSSNGKRLSDMIYPPNPFSPETAEIQEYQLRATEVAQPAIGAISLGLFKVLRSFGIETDALAGHSFGELTALCVSGCLDENDYHEFSRLRGRLMAMGSGDRGGMLAVSAPVATVEKTISEEGLALVIANRNAPRQMVLSGDTGEIRRAESLFSSRGIPFKRLAVSAAFHSPLVADAVPQFLASLGKIDFKPCNIPVYANTIAERYPEDPSEARKLFANQLANPVDFIGMIEAMYENGVRTFIEVGPGCRLSGLIRSILGDQNHTALSLDSSSGKRSGMVDLARLLAQLASLGYGENLSLWDYGFAPLTGSPGKPALTVPICGANYVKPKAVRPPVTPQTATVTKPSPLVIAKEERSTEMQSSSSPHLSRESLSESLRMSRESMSILLKMQEETAQLHRRFLEGQETAAKTFQILLEQQQRLFHETDVPLPMELRKVDQVAFKQIETSPANGHQLPGVGSQALVSGDRGLDAESRSQGIQIFPLLISVVSEKTGYPAEMLEPEMALDSDLGIDSIKRVEILSAIREKLPEAPSIGPEHLGRLRTLAEIAAHLESMEKRLDTEDRRQKTGDGREEADNRSQNTQVLSLLISVVSEKTDYPAEMLEPEMALDSDLGIDSIKRVEILSAIREKLPEAPSIGPEHLGRLRTLAEIAAHLESGEKKEEKRDEQPAGAIPKQPSSHSAISRSWITAVSIDNKDKSAEIPLCGEGELWVTDDGSTFADLLCALVSDRGLRVRRIDPTFSDNLVPPAMVSGLVIISPQKGADDLYLENSFLTLKNVGTSLRNAASAGGAIFVTVSRLDGAFGCGAALELIDPLSGGLAGLAKTASREWPEVNCKAIDLGEFSDHEVAASTLASEIFQRGPLEVGLTPSGRFELRMEELPAFDTSATAVLSEGEVVIMTGGGRGVTAATAITLTAAFRPLLVLLGRSPEPTPEPEWLSPLTDETRIKKGIIEHAIGKLHPRDIEERFRGIIAGRELRSTLEKIAAAGGKAIYRSIDIRDAEAVASIMDEVRALYGPVRGLVHGAGILADRLIGDKSREQFSMVYSTKVQGLRSLLNAVRGDNLRFIVLFSSITGRLGRIGQIDYAVANETINKLALAESRLRPDCRTVSINWGPWDGGMVTPALKKVFTAEGVGLIGLEEGGEFLIRELSTKGAPVEIVAIAGTEGISAKTAQTDRTPSLSEAVTLNLTLDGYPFLRSHVLDGKAVLPMAVIVEWLAHGALHGNPGFRFHGFNDLRICKGVIFEEDTSCVLKVLAGRAEKRDTFFLVPVELSCAGKDGRPILHAKAEIVLASRLPEGIRSIVEIPINNYQAQKGELYDRERLFHGPELHGIEQVLGCSEKGIAAMVKGAPPPAAWIRQPLRSAWITDPLVLDSAFQMMILWSFERFGAGSLPCFAGRYRQFIETFPREGVQVVIRITAECENSAHSHMEFLDRNSGKLIARLEDYECVIDPSLKQAFRRNRLDQTGPVRMGAA